MLTRIAPQTAALRLNLSGVALCWRLPFCRSELHTALSVMLGALGCEAAELDLLLVRDREMTLANIRHMGCPGPTNVLSFPLDASLTPDTLPLQLGSLILSVDVVHREAMLYGQDAREHCLRLLSHGLGHLAGYDHGPEMDALCETMLEAALQWADHR